MIGHQNIFRLGLSVGLAVGLCGCGKWDVLNLGLMGVNAQPEAPPAQAEKPNQNGKELNNPLLRELRKYAEQAKDFEEFDADKDDILKQLDEADKILTKIKAENKQALKDVNRQVRTNLAGRCPNVVMIVAPRLGVGDLGSYGQTKIPTPNLDALAKSGVRFTDFYAGADSMEASHWALQTGWTASRSENKFRIKSSTYTLPESLWQGGYHTAFYGAWMAPNSADASDTPINHGFDEWAGSLTVEEAHTAYPKSLWVNEKQVNLPVSEKPVMAGELVVQAAIKELEQQQRARRPFFLMIVLPPYLDMAADFADVELSKDSNWPANAQSYGAAVRMIDRDFGRIQSALNRFHLTRKTTVLFTALTGANAESSAATKFFQSRGRFVSQVSPLSEGVLRVPLIASFPGVIPEGETIMRPAAIWDFLPTFTQHTFTMTPRKNMDGVSFAPWFGNPQLESSPKLLYWQTADANEQAVRLGQWKGMKRAGSNHLELYDLNKDPGETQDVSNQHPDIVKQLIKPAG